MSICIKGYEKISPTARLVAYLRTFTDIPHSTEIATLCNAREAFELIAGDALDDFLQLAPMNEMRYKATDAVLDKYACRKNIIELASGISPRGLIRSRNALCSYLETDLPEIIAEKKAIVTSDILKGDAVNQLKFLAVNAVDGDQFFAMEHHVCDGPVAILSEGLVMYLTIAERERLAQNVYQFLRRRGGIWIIPDFSFKEGDRQIICNPRVKRAMQRLADFTEREVGPTTPVSSDPPLLFLDKAGFKRCSVFKQRELVPHLVSIDAVSSDLENIEDMLACARVVVMEVPAPI